MPLDSASFDPTIEILERVYHRLAKPGAWIQDCGAENEQGYHVSPLDEGAVRFCLMGAIVAETREASPDGALRQVIRRGLGFENDTEIVRWNDHKVKTQAGALKSLRKRIAKARNSIFAGV